MPGEIAWDAPLAAAALAPAAGLAAAWLAARRLGPVPRVRALGAAAARGLAVALCVAAAAGPHRVTETRPRGARLLAAPSDSASPLPPADHVVTWPADAPDARTALESLRASAPPGRPSDLMLAATDGTLPAAALRELAHGLRAEVGLRPGVLALAGGDPPPPAQRPVPPAPRLVAPAGATEGVAVTLFLEAFGDPFPAGRAEVVVGSRRAEVELAEDARRAAFPPLDLPAGDHLAVARVEGRPPAVATVAVAGPPRVLLVVGSAGEARAVEPAVARLQAQGLALTVLSEPLDRGALDDAAVVILGPGAGAADAGAVADRLREGAGLLVSGGPGGRGLARLRGTDLAPLLPVEIPEPPPPPEPAPEPPPPAPEEPPPPAPERPRVALEEADKDALRVALLLCVDRSGSMAGPKLRMAQQAALAAAATLDPQDRVAVVAFDEEAQWIAPFQDARDLRQLARRVGGLRADGGTNFYPALKEAYDAIRKEAAGIRHVLLLTDGVTRPAVFRELVEEGTARGVTLSAVAVGDGADTHLLGLLAGWGRGRLYPAVDPDRLPQVVTVDARRFGRSVREERRAALEDARGLPEAPPGPEEPPPPPPPEPVAAEAPELPAAPPPEPVRPAAPAPFLAGLEDAQWPRLPHAERVEVRGPAVVALRFVRDDAPALVLGRAGLGRVAVLAADGLSREAAELHAWAESGAFLAQLVRALAEPGGRAAPDAAAAVIELDDGSAWLHVDAPGGGALSLDALGGGEPLHVSLAPAAWGSLGRLGRVPDAGVYAGHLASLRGDAMHARRVLLVSPGPLPKAPGLRLARLAASADAPLHLEPPEPPRGAPRTRRESLAAPLLVAAAGLILAEAALRRAART